MAGYVAVVVVMGSYLSKPATVSDFFILRDSTHGISLPCLTLAASGSGLNKGNRAWREIQRFPGTNTNTGGIQGRDGGRYRIQV
jgi:hypothetical protein